LYPFRARLRVGSLGSNSRLGGLIIAVAEDAAWDVVNENGPRASTEQIRLLVVDDHAAVRRGLRELLEDQPDFRVIDAVPSAEEGDVWSAIQLFRHRDTDPSVEDNPLVAAARRVLPLSGSYSQGRIVTRVDGHHAFTPLFLGTSQSPSSPGR
jgi:hypothetical protein